MLCAFIYITAGRGCVWVGPICIANLADAQEATWRIRTVHIGRARISARTAFIAIGTFANAEYICRIVFKAGLTDALIAAHRVIARGVGKAGVGALCALVNVLAGTHGGKTRRIGRVSLETHACKTTHRIVTLRGRHKAGIAMMGTLIQVHARPNVFRSVLRILKSNIA